MKFFHTALAVENLEESQTFYENVFEMKLKSQGERPEINVRFLILEGTDGICLELFEHNMPDSLEENLMDFSKVGYKHISFSVDDVDAAVDLAVKHGAKVLWPPKAGVTVKRIAFVSDPNGLPIELVQL
ncbi:MAG: VOC family protein [Weeksellaceae bacterium]